MNSSWPIMMDPMGAIFLLRGHPTRLFKHDTIRAYPSSICHEIHYAMWWIPKDMETYLYGRYSSITSSDFWAIWEVGYGLHWPFWPSMSIKEVHHYVHRLFDQVGWGENIFYKFGFPRELGIDQYNQFATNMIERTLRQHHIIHRKSTPYHPRENGKVEVTIRALESTMTKVVRSSKKDWEKRLVEVT